MIKRGILSVIFLVNLSTLITAAAHDAVYILKQTPNSLTLQVSFPEPEIQPLQDGSISIDLPGIPRLDRHGPYLTHTFSLPGRKLQYTIINIKTKRIESDAARKIAYQHSEWVRLDYQGLFRRVPLHSITFFPLRGNARGIESLESITIEIRSVTATAQPGKIPAADFTLLNKMMLNASAAGSEEIRINESAAYFPYQTGRFKLLVEEEGLYQVTYDDLIDAAAPVDQYDTRRLRLLNRGREIPVFFKGGQDGSFDPGDYFEFWGEKNRSDLTEKYPDIFNDPFSDVNVYWLENSDQNGLRMVEESGALSVSNENQYITPFFFTERIHFEQDREFIRFGHRSANIDSAGYTMDHWFYDRGISAVGSKTYNAHIPWPYRQQDYLSVFARVMMRGLSDSSRANPLLSNHQVDVWLNDAKVASSGRWKDQNYHVITNEGADGLPQRILRNGDNQLRIQMDQTGVTDIALLNWFDIEYFRRYRAHQNVLRFKKQDDLPPGFVYQFEVDGFSKQNIEVYKLGVSKLVNTRLDYHTATDGFNSYRVSFQDEIFYPDLEYVAITSDQKKKPLSIIPDRPWSDSGFSESLLADDNRADYLIITHDLFYESARRLREYRQQQGWSVELIRVHDIYDEFNYGIKSPLAIRDFLRYVFEKWDQSNPLQYVLLVGDASFDYKRNIASSKTDYVPTFLFETEKYGASASDYLYTLVSGADPIADLIIGRIPVETNTELNAYIDKVFGYESADNTGDWRVNTLFISGNDAYTPEYFTGLPAFRAQNQRLISMRLPEANFARKLNTVRDTSITAGDPNFGGTNTLINHFDDGLSMINFFGHGGGGIWADVYLMSTEDVSRLNNGFRLPFVQSMTCFTGAFENSKLNGLAEKLVLEPERGAIGVLAASGVGWLANDFALGWDVTDYLLDGSYTVGEAILKAKIDYLANNLYVTENFDTVIPSYRVLRLSMVNHYNLIGDPLVKIPVPPLTLSMMADNKTPATGDTVSITLTAPFSTGSGRIELSDEKRQRVSERFFALSSGQAEFNFDIPDELSEQNIFVTAYAEDGSSNSDARGEYRLTVNKPLIDSLVYSPKNPQIGDPIYFSVYLTPVISVSQVKITNLRDSQGQIYTIVLQKSADSLWTSQNPFGPYTTGDTVYFDIQITDSEGASYLSRRHMLAVSDPRPDVLILNDSFQFDGREQILLQAQIENRSDQNVDDMIFAIYADQIGGAEPPVYSEEFNLTANQSVTVSHVIPQELLQQDRQFIAFCDVQESIDERDEQNNIASTFFSGELFNVPQLIGTTTDGHNNDTLAIGSAGKLFIPAQGLSATTVLEIQSLDLRSLLPDTESQPGFVHVPFGAADDSSVISIRIKNPDARVLSPAYIDFGFDTTLVEPAERADLRLCQYNSKLNRWLALTGSVQGNRIQAAMMNAGLFALFHVSDTEKPVIEITVNGRIAYNDMLIPQNPNLAILLQDANGIDLTSGLEILIDDLPIDADNQLVPDSTGNANAVSVLTTPTLAQGRHELTVSVRDARGNLSFETIEFRVETDFSLQVFGNYPNPFGADFDETYISFEVGAIRPLDRLELKIYTVSGRMIRKISASDIGQPDQKLLEPGYHELLWDGLDDNGDLVANGVYFGVLKIDLAGKTKEETLKIAVLR